LRPSAQRVNAEAIDLAANTRFKRIFANDAFMHCTSVERLVEFAVAIVNRRTEHWAGGISAVAGKAQVFFNQAQRHGWTGIKRILSRLPLILKCITP